jgi:hypothetical protein
MYEKGVVMKNRCGVYVALMILGSSLMMHESVAQFKRTSAEEPKVSDSFIRPATASEWFDFFNPDNFKMRQSYSMSYTSMGGQGLALGMYTNSLQYKFSNSLDARVDVSLQHSPYSTFDRRVQNSLSGVFLNRAEINYRPAENMLLRVSYQHIPFGLSGYYSPYAGFFHGMENYEGY